MGKTTIPSAPRVETLPSASSAEDILGVDDCTIVPLAVPEWKRTIHLRMLDADEGLSLSEKLDELKKSAPSSAAMFLILSMCICDEQGKRLFVTDEQVAKLKTRNIKVLIRIQDEVLKLLGFVPNAKETAKNGLSEVPSGASPTVSQSN